MSQRLLELFYVADIDYSWVATFLSLLLLPAAHEDVAIILGGYLVVNQLMPVGVVVLTIYVGMVASDLALYVIGVGARYLPWLSRFAVTERVKNFGATLQRNLFGLAALGRVVPGAIFVIMMSCGWTRVPWTRVALASLFSSALYLPLMLYLVIVFGDALDDRVGLWTWPFLLGLLVALAFMRYRVFTFREDTASTAGSDLALAHPQRHPRHAFVRPARAVQWTDLLRWRTTPRAERSPRLP